MGSPCAECLSTAFRYLAGPLHLARERVLSCYFMKQTCCIQQRCWCQRKIWAGCQRVCMPCVCFLGVPVRRLMFAWPGFAERGCNCLGCFGSALHPTSVGAAARLCGKCVCGLNTYAARDAQQQQQRMKKRWGHNACFAEMHMHAR
jgi:hypothetical protein